MKTIFEHSHKDYIYISEKIQDHFVFNLSLNLLENMTESSLSLIDKPIQILSQFELKMAEK